MTRPNWSEREAAIREQFPGALDIDWIDALTKDRDIFASLLGEVIKSSSKSKRKRRPTREEAEIILSQLSGEDFSSLSFSETFYFITKGLSVDEVAQRLGWESSSMVDLLLEENATPSLKDMEEIADAFNRQPSFFLEYRIWYICDQLNEFLLDNPESSEVWYNKLRRLR